MTEQTIGTARIDLIVDMSQMKAEIERAKTLHAQMGQAGEAAYQQLNAGAKRATTNLLQWANNLGKTAEEQKLLNAAMRGVPIEALEVARQAILKQRDAQQALNAAQGGTAKSTKELQAALRGVPAQVTDIVTSLASGQAPFTVLLQQGGQLKDMFGGIGPAAKALGTSLLGLINPLTLTAGAAAALIYLWKEGSGEADAYNQALLVTGNYAGVTAGHMADLAKSISDSVGTQHEAAAALAEVAEAGKFTGDQIALVGKAALDMARLNGQATADTIKQYEELKEKPVQAVLKLNEAQHFLTLEVYEQIKALEDSGHAQEAAALAMKTYADTTAQRSKAVVQNLGDIERGWNAIKNAIKGAGDALLGVGRAESDDDKIARLKAASEAAAKKLDQLQNQGAPQSSTFSLNLQDKYYYPSQLAEARKVADQALAAYREELAKQNAARQKAKADADQAQLVQDKADSDKEVQEFATNAQKRATELAKVQGEYNERIARALASGNKKLADELRASEKVVLAGITEKYKDPKQPKSPEVSAYATFKGQVDALDVKTISADDVALTKYQQGIRQLADEMQVYIDKGGDATKAADLFNRGQQALYKTLQQTRAQETDAEKQYAAALDKSNQALALQVNNEVARIGMGQKEYERTQQINQAYQDQAAALADLALKRQMGVDGKSGGISQDQYDADVAALQDATNEKVRILQDGYARSDAAQADWLNGAKMAYQDWVDQAADVAGQTDALFTNTFDNLADGIAGAMTSGKFSVKDFIKSALSDFAKMEARLATMKLLQMVLGAFLGGNRTTGAGDSLNGGANYTGNGSLSTSWPGMSGGGWSTNAKGGVYSSPSLSAYSNGVYNSPQVFAFAKGAGVFAEAGPEAIMPLRRGPDGRLGVAAAGVGGGGIVFNQYNNIASDGTATSDTRSSGDQRDLVRRFGDGMKQVAQQEILRAVQPGGTLWGLGVGQR